MKVVDAFHQFGVNAMRCIPQAPDVIVVKAQPQ